MASSKNTTLSWRIISCYCRDMRCLSNLRPTSILHLTLIEQNQCVNTRHKCDRSRWREVVKVPCRTFFNLPGITNKKKEYSGRKLVGYSMEQMYEVVSDVKNYTEFVPFCKRSDILSQRPGHLKADLIIGFPPILESYTSSVTLTRPHLVKAECTEGKLFDHLVTLWRFSPGLKNNPQSCVIDFSVSFEFRSVLHSQIAHIFFNEVVRQMEGAFLTEARRRYGKATVKSQKLAIISTARS